MSNWFWKQTEALALGGVNGHMRLSGVQSPIPIALRYLANATLQKILCVAERKENAEDLAYPSNHILPTAGATTAAARPASLGGERYPATASSSDCRALIHGWGVDAEPQRPHVWCA